MNTFGRLFKISIYGESHSAELGVVVDGVPQGLELSVADFIQDLKRRQPGARGTTPRKEEDLPEISSGIYQGFTTGAPLHLKFSNKNTHSKDYEKLKKQPRPGHADFTAIQKYQGFNDPRGGGIFSGRLTLLLVAAGVVAKKVLAKFIPDLELAAKLLYVGQSKSFAVAVKELQGRTDSLGGLAELVGKQLPAGLGEPFFDSLESLAAHLLFSIPGVKGVEFGSGFQAAKMTGSEHNDCYLDAKGTTLTNNNGGLSGGLTNGNDLIVRVAFKPTPSIGLEQETYDFTAGKVAKLNIGGRHDQCLALRTPVIVEASLALVLADLYLINKTLYN